MGTVEISGYTVLIDDEDVWMVNKYRYGVQKMKLQNAGLYYFMRSSNVQGKKDTPLLHREIMKCDVCDGKIVDHINGNTLDCRKENLRICTHAENIRNSKTYKTNTSGVKGVTWYKKLNKWCAQIQVDKKKINLGYFLSIKDAEKAYAEGSKKYHGEFGRLS